MTNKLRRCLAVVWVVTCLWGSALPASAATSSDVAVAVSDSPDPVTAGNNLTYTLTFTNSGPDSAASVTVTDPVPAKTTFVSAAVTTGSGWSTSAPAVGAGGNVVFSKATVGAGETAVFTLVVKVNSGATNGATLSNTATAASATSDPNSGNNTGTATTSVDVFASLTLSVVDSPNPVAAGANLTETFTIKNSGPSDALNVSVSDSIPSHTTFVSAWVPSGSVSAPPVGGTGSVLFSLGTIVANATVTCTLVVKVDAGLPAGTVVGAGGAVVAGSGNLAVTVTDSPDPVTAGTNLTYTINFVNNGPDAVANVAVTDAVPANATFVSAAVTTGSGWSTSAPAVGGTGNVVFSKAAVASGETAVFTLVVAVNAGAANGATLSNSATAGSPAADPNTGDNTATTTTTVQAGADLAVTVTDSPDPATAGNNLTYTLNFVNNGPVAAASVTVVDAVPANATFVSAAVTTGSGWSTSAPAVGGIGNVVFSKAAVAPGETAAFTLVVRVNASAADGATLTDSATAASTTTDPNTGNNTGTATTTVQARADLAVTVADSPDPAEAGGNLTYTLNFANNGPSDAATVTVADAVPADATFVSAAVTTGSGWSTSAPAVGGTGNVVFSKAAVASGETAAFTLVVRVNAGAADDATLTDSATAASTTTDPNTGNNTGTATTTVQARADLAVTVTDSPDPAEAGANLTYTVNFANNGPSDAGNVTVVDAMPADATFVSAAVTTGSGWSTSAPAVGGTGNVVFSKAAVAPGETAAFTLVVKVNAGAADGATLSDSATAASTTTDPNTGNNTAAATTTVQTRADLAVTVTDSPDPVLANADLTYTIVLANGGPSDAAAASWTDALPAGTTFVSLAQTSGPTWSCTTGATVACSTATFAAGATASFALVVHVDARTADGTVVTDAAAVLSATSDPGPDNNAGTTTTAVIARADISLLKSTPAYTVSPGALIRYTITANNEGPTGAVDAVVSDTLPAETTFVSLEAPAGWSCTTPAVGSGGTVSCSNPLMTIGSPVFALTVRTIQHLADGAVIANTVMVSSSSSDPNPGAESATARTEVEAAADLSIRKSASLDRATGGRPLAYSLHIDNNGPDVAYHVSAVDTLPASLTFGSVVGEGWACQAASGAVTCARDWLDPGAAPDIVITGTAPAERTTLVNAATISSGTPDLFPADNRATVTTTVVGQVYLPAVSRNAIYAPDLVIDALLATAAGITVTLRNAGNAAVLDPFWVDVYFDPRETPRVNRPWPLIAAHGAAWGVTRSLASGESLTLTRGGPYYSAADSSPLPFPAPAAVYAFADSVDFAASYGAVWEGDERNNLWGPVDSMADTVITALSPTQPPASTSSRLPRR